MRGPIPALPATDDADYATDEDAQPTPATRDDSTAGDEASPAELGEPNPISPAAKSADELDAATEDGPELEVIRERHPNGAIKIERTVTQDADGNYVNEGRFRMWDQHGGPLLEGTYHHGRREGVWNRWVRPADAELLTKLPYNSFAGPFVSQATFVNDKLDGAWTIYDGRQHKISQFDYVDGQRDGRMTWWFPNGRKMREIEYRQGEIDGQYLEWAIDGKLLTKDTYEHGRKLAAHTEKDKAGVKKSEGIYLFAREVEKTPDDWWNLKLATYTKQGKDEKHGPFVTWYTRGQKQSEGEYRNDVQVGKFTWWYANGQKSIQGGYSDGEQEGKWVWWHENGQKSIQGEYSKGHPVGRWTWWNQDGKVARSTEMEGGTGEIVTLPEKPQAQPQVRSGAKPLGPGQRPTRLTPQLVSITREKNTARQLPGGAVS